MPTNPLIDDRDVRFQLEEVLDAPSLCRLPAFSEHSPEGFRLFLDSCARLAREALFPAYRPMDEQPPRLEGGRVKVHPRMRDLYPRLVELGVLDGTRSPEVGGAGLPTCVFAAASAYLMAANLSATGYAGLTSGAAHLLEVFGSPALRERFMRPLYEGRWTGTMALTEPHAGSSLADVRTRATPTDEEGVYRISGSKIFISGGDQDFAENTVHLTLARIDGAPPGSRGISLFAVPAFRPEGDALVPNDVSVAGVIHKIGWRGLPSLALNYGEAGDCKGWLVGAPHRGLAAMFQMMNEARLMVGMNATATASVAYHEAVNYARERPQGRAATVRDVTSPQVPIIEHADVRRMLLRQKAIVEGALSLLLYTSLQADLARHGPDEDTRARAQALLDLLTPVAKTFPAEKGFEANALAVQVHGGYGYSSEYLPEAWLRDQKLNTIHEGTSGIQSLDLLGRKAVAGGGASLALFGEEVAATVKRAREAGLEEAWCLRLERALDTLGQTTLALGQKGLEGDVDGMLLHSADYLELFSLVATSWRWLEQAQVAKRALERGASGPEAGFYRAKLLAAQYWLNTELPRAEHLAHLCTSAEDSYARLQPEWL